ncbi:serine hydrolase [Bradyrhizobium sp. CSA112]|uniref:serine hydrolase n=1 Tax=Bradyrhizobium sp. CSA112 TaxID=2699170 RepID=UPI0023B1E920|nr:serine hydrolase [Bradyrhizobium sp. CSA112]
MDKITVVHPIGAAEIADVAVAGNDLSVRWSGRKFGQSLHLSILAFWAPPSLRRSNAASRLRSACYQPGTGWEYSLTTDVLRAVIEKVTGNSLESFVTERFMTKTAIIGSGAISNPIREAFYAAD